MKATNITALFFIVAFFSVSACSSSGAGDSSSSYGTIARYQQATESSLRAIPDSAIAAARTNLHIAYFHTSHGTHVAYGVFGLPDYKPGDSTRFAVTNRAVAPTSGSLDFNDYYAETSPYSDLSQADSDWAAWLDQVRAFLDDADNARINVMMWSWCDITGHDVSGGYLPSMETLIGEYGPGGSKIGSGSAQTRVTPVTFIFMTGHGVKNSNIGSGKPKNQAELIVEYCESKGYYCLDYWSIDSHDMSDSYWEDSGDDGDSDAYTSSTGSATGSFYIDWQAARAQGADWYANRDAPGGGEIYGMHNNQHITANRKAYAFWWLMARVAGWNSL